MVLLCLTLQVGGCLQYLKGRSIPPSNFLQVPALGSGEAEVILKGWLKENARTLTDKQFKLVTETSLDASKESPTPLRLRLLCDLALEWRSYDAAPDAALPRTVEALIDEIFTRLERRHGDVLVAAFCGILGVSRRGVSENDLVDILSTDDDVLASVLQYHAPPVRRLPYHLVARLRHDLRRYLVERGEYNKSFLYWFHRQFWQCAERRYLPLKETGGTESQEDKKSRERDKYSYLVMLQLNMF